MPLKIFYVERLEDVLGSVREFLERPGDLFARPRIVVPTAGAKAWLWSELAKTLGATAGAEGGGRPAGDGIIANVDFSYPGTFSALLEPAAGPPVGLDPWDVESLTFAILDVIATDPAYAAVVTRAGGPLRAARRIADRFDHYHFRRPGMILEWEAARARLSPAADGGVIQAASLRNSDRWQFDLWRAVRSRIGRPSPPQRDRESCGSAPEAILVAGLQSLSLHQIELLTRLAATPSASGLPCDVQVVLVHPSPALRATWGAAAPPPSPGVSPARVDAMPSAGVDPLVDAWLRGSRECQWLLASQGIEPTHAPLGSAAARPGGSLLERLKQTVATGSISPAAVPPFDRGDHSVLIHRCHDLGRQAEVLHEAILHAFRDLERLAPHEVVIVSPRIAELAPHLEATFARAARGAGDAGIDLPLLVADRGIREVSRGAELLAALLDLIGSQCSVEGMMAVACHPLVEAHFGSDDDTVAVWRRCIERTRIRWGLDPDRRRRDGLDRPGLAAHTWRLGLERTLLGAVMPDGGPEPVLGGVVPLDRVDVAEVADLAPLASIFAIVDELDRTITAPRPVRDWCDLLETALGRLAGEENDELAEPVRELDALRQAAAAAAQDGRANVAVPYHDVKVILAATLAAPVGRQPLRTGMITATSMIPLRGVPFRVVCLAGFDDVAVAPRDGDAEDLADREPRLLGDADPRLEVRRGLLDCLLAAGQRLIVTCTGMDVKNNATLPLPTALAEFVDFVGRHGVPAANPPRAGHSAIEIFHPRHACSRRNFVARAGGVVGADVPWSHDVAALAAAVALGRDVPSLPLDAAGVAAPVEIDFVALAEFMHDPLWPYVRKTLDITTWRADERATPALLPLELDTLERRRLLDGYLAGTLVAADRGAFRRSWEHAARAQGDVPVLGFGDAVLDEITQFVDSLVAVAERTLGARLSACTPATFGLDLDGIALAGTVERCLPDARNVQTVVLVRPDAMKSSSPQFGRAKMLAVVLLLATRAARHPVERAVILNRHEDWHPGAVKANGEPLPAAQARTITLAPTIDAPRARQLLGELCMLYRTAATVPRAGFGGASLRVGDDRESARDAFATFVSGQRYADGNEAVVYGAQPDFDAVFPDDPAVTDFFSRYHALTAVSRRYVYQPDEP